MRITPHVIVLLFGCLTLSACGEEETTAARPAPPPIEPDWSAIAAWPDGAIEAPDAAPDPARQINAIILDDSSSMGVDIDPAKDAVVEALGAMGPADRVAVLALNEGLILPFMDVVDAQGALPSALARISSRGSTPLTDMVRLARALLSDEAARARAFGTYRLILTTDGAANDGSALNDEVEDIARRTPIQIATIGIGIQGDHVLRRPSLTTFVTIDNASQLGGALKEAIAESQDFQAIISFAEEG